MAMEGFLFKGAGESTEGFRQKKFDDDAAMQDRKFKREVSAWDMLNKTRDREALAKQHSSQLGLQGASGVVNSLLDSAAKSEAIAADIIAKAYGRKLTPEAEAEVRRHRFAASRSRSQAQTYVTGMASRYGFSPAKSTGGVFDKLNALGGKK